MSKFLNALLYIIFVIYVIFVLALSTIILKQNSYGVTEYKEYLYVLINDKNETPKYIKGDLVVLKDKNVNNVKVGEEVFVYNRESNTIKNGIISEVVTDGITPYILLEGDSLAYKNDVILGKGIKIYHKIGNILSFLEGKWTFFYIVILPCSLLAIYELYYIFKNLIYDNKK